MMATLARRVIAWRGVGVGVLLLGAVALVMTRPARRGDFWEITWTVGIWLGANMGWLGNEMPSGRGRLWWAAYVASIAAVVGWAVMGLWEIWPRSEPWEKVASIACGTAAALGVYLTAMLALRGRALDGWWTAWARRTARWSATAVLVGWVTMLVLANLHGSIDRDPVFWLIGPAMIVMTAAMMWLPGAVSLDAVARVQEELAPEGTGLVGCCPRCGQGQRFLRGEGRCESCGLCVAVEFDEPRCECGYLLYGLRGNACPECGRVFRAGANTVSPPAARSGNRRAYATGDALQRPKWR